MLLACSRMPGNGLTAGWAELVTPSPAAARYCSARLSASENLAPNCLGAGARICAVSCPAIPPAAPAPCRLRSSTPAACGDEIGKTFVEREHVGVGRLGEIS